VQVIMFIDVRYYKKYIFFEDSKSEILSESRLQKAWLKESGRRRPNLQFPTYSLMVNRKLFDRITIKQYNMRVNDHNIRRMK
jgi:hypothetical protein